MQDGAVGGDHFGAEKVVAGKTVLAVEPSESAAEGEPGDSGEGDDAERGGEPVLLRAPVEFTEQEARSRADGALGGVDHDGFHRGQVQDQAVVAHRVAGDVVAAALDRQG